MNYNIEQYLKTLFNDLEIYMKLEKWCSLENEEVQTYMEELLENYIVKKIKTDETKKPKNFYPQNLFDSNVNLIFFMDNEILSVGNEKDINNEDVVFFKTIPHSEIVNILITDMHKETIKIIISTNKESIEINNLINDNIKEYFAELSVIQSDQEVFDIFKKNLYLKAKDITEYLIDKKLCTLKYSKTITKKNLFGPNK